MEVAVGEVCVTLKVSPLLATILLQVGRERGMMRCGASLLSLRADLSSYVPLCTLPSKV